MDRSGAGYRGLLIGRGCYLGALWGAVYGGGFYLAGCLVSVASGGLLGLFFVQFACYIGAIVGAASGLAGGLALALGGPRVTGGQRRARLVAGGAAAAVPLAVGCYLHEADPSLCASLRLWVAAVAAVAAGTAALLTPRMVREPSPPRYVALPGSRVIPPVRPAVERTEEREFAEPAAVYPFRRGLIIGRGVGWGIVGGTVLGAFTWLVWCVQFGAVKPLALVGFAAVFGAALGGCLGLVAGLVLALGGARAVRPMYRAQLIAGGVVTAVLSALIHLGGVSTLGVLVRYLDPSLAVAAALAAVLLTPCIVGGLPERRNPRAPG